MHRRCTPCLLALYREVSTFMAVMARKHPTKNFPSRGIECIAFLLLLLPLAIRSPETPRNLFVAAVERSLWPFA
jgi:hypothetical protein